MRIGIDMSKEYKIPKPKFQIGDKVVFDWYVYHDNTTDKPYYTKKIVRHLIRKYRKWYKYPKPLCDEYKRRIKECLYCIANAISIEVAGIIPKGYNVGDTQFNQCYLSGVSGASSPLSYDYQLCFRYMNHEGNIVAYIPEIGMGGKNLKNA